MTDPAKPAASPHTAPAPVSLAQAFWFWLKLGFISFGGPAGQIAIMHQELVEQRRWISERRFLHALNYCMVLPGPEAQQLVTYIGWLMHKRWGGVVAGALFVLPSLFILIALSWVYIAFGEVSVVAGLFYGIKPAVTAIVVQAAHRIGSKALKNQILWAIAAASFVAIFALNVPFPFIVGGAALVGYVGGRLSPHTFQVGGGHGASQASYGPALIDDHTPTPDHAHFSWTGLMQVLVAGAVLWSVPMGVLCAVFGWDHTFTQMGWFFTKAALLTFGGAYAVLPYVYQGAVDRFGWVTPTHMMDGLALGETTPGPLIMVVAFVAFVGGYLKALLGPDQLFAAGALAACLVTWFTFLPSFIFILAGGPLVESTHRNLKFTAPLTAITAAVVGVVLNLALFFGYHLLWPQGFGGATAQALSSCQLQDPLCMGFDWRSALIALGAAIALFKYKRSVMQVIGVCALIGLAIKTLPL